VAPGVSHPADSLDEVVHQKTRLGILAVLAEGGQAQFGFVRDVLGLSDGNLSRHLAVLEQARYVEIHKGYEGKRPRTWVKITKAGRTALAAEVAVLKSIMDRLPEPRPKPSRVSAHHPQPGLTLLGPTL
jgi:DNA-binding MarR family transcriptional regulator